MDYVQGGYISSPGRGWSTSAPGAKPGPIANGMAGNPYKSTQNHFAHGKSEQIVDEAIISAMTGARLADPTPRELFPPRIGYERVVPDVAFILADTNRNMGKDHRWDYSGVRYRFTGTSHPGIGHV